MQGKSLAFSCDIARRYAEQLSQQPYAQQGGSAKLMREQNCRNAQLVPIYRGQPANEHRLVLGNVFIFRCLVK